MNKGLVTEWYEKDNLRDLYSRLEDGDLLEFRRQGYSHWAVYVGVYTIDLNRGLKPCVIHRSLPLEAETKPMQLASHSVYAAFNGENAGPVIMEPLEEVLYNDRVRINNGSDSCWTPFKPSEITERARRNLYNTTPDVYSIIKNNCEHFANRCRYGRNYSGQVIGGCLKFGTSSLGVALSTARVAAVVASPLAIASTPMVAAAATLVGTVATLIPLAMQACEASRSSRDNN